MDAKKIQAKLEEMKGKTFKYAEKIHVVNSYMINQIDEKFTIKSDQDQWVRKFESAAQFLSYWQEVEAENLTQSQYLTIPDTKQTPPAEVPEFFVEEKNLANDLVSILKDNIKRVQANAGYIKQAEVINENVSSIISVQRLKLDMYRTVKGK